MSEVLARKMMDICSGGEELLRCALLFESGAHASPGCADEVHRLRAMRCRSERSHNITMCLRIVVWQTCCIMPHDALRCGNVARPPTTNSSGNRAELCELWYVGAEPRASGGRSVRICARQMVLEVTLLVLTVWTKTCGAKSLRQRQAWCKLSSEILS